MQGESINDVGPTSTREQGGDTHRRGRWMLLVYATAAIVVALDQAAKLAAVAWLRPLDSVPLIGPWVSLTWATNTGGAFGVLSSSTTLLAIVATLVVVALIYTASRLGSGRLVAVGVALVIGGAIGNLIDRVRVGYVIDYIDFHFWPVFNIADIAITIGAGLLVIAALTGHSIEEPGGEESE